MAISTIATLKQSMGVPFQIQKTWNSTEAAGVITTWWGTGGSPTAASPPSGGLPGTTLTAPVAGQLPYQNPVGSALKYLAMMQAAANNGGGTIILVDRLWHNSGVATATLTEQSINGMSTLPDRDILGSTGGRGLILGVHVFSTTGNNAAITNMWIRYTNDAGTANRIASCSTFPATCVTGSFIPFPLQHGDTGVRQVNGIALGTTLSIGNVAVALVRPIGMIGLPATIIGSSPTDQSWQDAVSLGLPRIYDGSVLEMWMTATSNTTASVGGAVRFAEG